MLQKLMEGKDRILIFDLEKNTEINGKSTNNLAEPKEEHRRNN
jgi:hypothetical protein